MSQYLDHNTTYRMESYRKWDRTLNVMVPSNDEIEGGEIFSGIALGAIHVTHQSTGQQASLDVEFVIEGAESVEMAFEMYDDAKDKAVKKAQADLTKPKLAIPSGTTLPNAEGPKL